MWQPGGTMGILRPVGIIVCPLAEGVIMKSQEILVLTRT
jgi:hypothetical protein